MTMKPISDEQLSAYLDGELDTAEMQAIEAELAASAELSARMDALRATNDAARAYFSQPDETPVPDALLQMIQTQPLPQTDEGMADQDKESEARADDNVVPLRKSGKSAGPRIPMATWGIAASLVLGLTLMFQYRPDGAIDAGLNQFADTALSGDIHDGGERRTELAMSFENADGEFCREVIQHTPESSRTLIACGEPGDWHWQVMPETPGYQTASGPEIAGARVLSDAEERAWLGQE
ncbi:MAG TPA: hypothetical protein DEA26_10545 [Oceanospirillales bacterium]|nr:hypothetical protein [Oceanospirillales bacterium]|tara:strand:+ start:1059 stop:1772 length:714 start_codon:yes stop_codon:yes gene_type:complete